MRAQLVLEKFTEKSDPVADMGIGGFRLSPIYKKIKDDAAKQWIKFLKDSLEGHTVKCTAMKWEEKGHNWRTFEFFVKKVVNDVKKHGFEHEVTVQDNDDKYYTLSGQDKIYIIG